MTTERSRRGRSAEDAALTLLCGHGLRLLARNVRSRGGEIDLVMRDGDTVVFVEVRSRRRSDYGTAAESVGARKQQRLIHAARTWLARNPRDARRPLRFDVVAYTGAEEAEWLRNAIEVSA